jgi:hypothetical protein
MHYIALVEGLIERARSHYESSAAHIDVKPNGIPSELHRDDLPR